VYVFPGGDVVIEQSVPVIRGDKLAAARISASLSIEQLANMVCMSTRQIEQLENGKTDAFYSPMVKVTAAKRVSRCLGVEIEECLFFSDIDGICVENELNATNFASNLHAHISPHQSIFGGTKTRSILLSSLLFTISLAVFYATFNHLFLTNSRGGDVMEAQQAESTQAPKPTLNSELIKDSTH
jgi:hypothetical protein